MKIDDREHTSIDSGGAANPRSSTGSEQASFDEYLETGRDGDESGEEDRRRRAHEDRPRPGRTDRSRLHDGEGTVQSQKNRAQARRMRRARAGDRRARSRRRDEWGERRRRTLEGRPSGDSSGRRSERGATESPSGSGARADSGEPPRNGTERGSAGPRGARAGRGDGVSSPEKSRREIASAAHDEASLLRNDALREVADAIVQAVRVGTDETRRRVVMLDVEVPEGGEVRIRLRRDAGGFETRLRAEDPEFARTLRRNRERLRESAAERDVELTHIEIA